jgi:2-polyprenyl-3-methyl-5-hydroxy-6-metoxy-1,4-benzoquinol methylase
MPAKDFSKNPALAFYCVGKFNFDQFKRSLLDLDPETKTLLRAIYIPDFNVEETFHRQLIDFAKENKLVISLGNFKHMPYKDGIIHKSAISWALKNEFDILISIHGSGNFDLSNVSQMIYEIRQNSADAVFGSRLLSLLSLNYPKYKFWGHKLLSYILKSIDDITATDPASNFRALNLKSISKIPYHLNSDGSQFDVEFIIQLHEADLKIKEIITEIRPETEFGLQKSLAFGFHSIVSALRYRMHKMGFGSGTTAFNSPLYEIKEAENTSHAKLLEMIPSKNSYLKVLDVGCSSGQFAEALKKRGYHITGIDLEKSPDIVNRLDEFHKWDLDFGLPQELSDTLFDVIVCADVLEHLKDPLKLLSELKTHLKANGSVFVSVPNISHWYSRIKIALGLFSYDKRGIFDESHLRFFTSISFKRLAQNAGFEVVRSDYTNTPLADILKRGMSKNSTSSYFNLIDDAAKIALKMWPNLFGYQLLFELKPKKTAHYNYLKTLDLNEDQI